MPLALNVAVSENNVIGIGGELPWKLSTDLQRFRQTTMGHHLIMGRKTFDSIGRLLPGRTTVIVTRQTDYRQEGAIVVNSAISAMEVVQGDLLPFVVGGSEIYALFLPMVDELYLTRVHANLPGDTFFPTIDLTQWQQTFSKHHSADAKNSHDYSFEVYQRRNGILSTGKPA